MCRLLSRLLLILAAIELITMPLTQHIWTWDRFLHGGQDFEFGVLTIVMSLCLAFVLAQHSKQGVNLLLAISRLFLCFLPQNESATSIREGNFSPYPLERAVSPSLASYSLPLQI